MLFVSLRGAHDVKFVDDKNNNRLLIYINKGDKDDVISYNYEHNKFISRHSYRFDKGYNTKSNTYIVKGNNVVQFDDSKFVTYDGLSGNKDSNAYVQTITNAGYYDMKFVEYIKYKLHQLDRRYNIIVLTIGTPRRSHTTNMLLIILLSIVNIVALVVWTSSLLIIILLMIILSHISD